MGNPEDEKTQPAANNEGFVADEQYPGPGEQPPPYPTVTDQPGACPYPKQENPVPGEPGAPTYHQVVPIQNPIIIVEEAPMFTDYLIASILVTIFCCCCTGIAAIVFAVQARSARDRREYENMVAKTKMAKNFTFASIAIGVGFIIGYIITLIIIS